MLAISIYIWVRFEWQFGVGALFALLHDVTLTIGLFALTQMEFDLNIVAALLTLIGYSLNDTIVVYDRIRENLKKYRRMPMPELLDLSVNETLSRTIVTSLSLLITLVALLLLGPDVIFGFTAAITLGIFVGTYSSIYMAAPILIWLKVNRTASCRPKAEMDRQERLARAFGACARRSVPAGRRSRTHFARAADIGDDQRRAAGERLDPGIGQALALGRQHQDIGGREQPRQHLVR
jgi:preprotein translocase subunit SecF